VGHSCTVEESRPFEARSKVRGVKAKQNRVEVQVRICMVSKHIKQFVSIYPYPVYEIHLCPVSKALA